LLVELVGTKGALGKGVNTVFVELSRFGYTCTEIATAACQSMDTGIFFWSTP
jgi:hypothetical protein